MDNHGSHLTLELLEFCEEKNILPFPFPSHMTDILQPLDGNPFQVFKLCFRKANSEVMRWGGVATDQADFLVFIPEIREKAFKRDTIIHAFRDRAICPGIPRLFLSPYVRRRRYTTSYNSSVVIQSHRRLSGRVIQRLLYPRSYLQQFEPLAEELESFLMLHRN